MILKRFQPILMRATRYLAWTVITFLSLTLLLVAGIFITLVVAQHNGKLDEWIKAGTGWDLRYQSMHVSMHAGHPSVVLEHVVFSDPKDPSSRFSIGEVEVDIALWPSIIARAPMTSQFLISNLVLDVVELPKGQWRINNMVVGGSSTNSDLLQIALTWLLNQKQINVKNLDLHLQFLNGSDYHFTPTNLMWYGKAQEFNLSASVAGMPKSKLMLNTDFFPAANVTDFDAWKIRFNGSVTAKDFSPLLENRDIYQLKFLSGGGNLSFNGVVENANLSQLQMGVSLNNLNLSHANAQPLQLTQVDEQIFWQSFGANQGWSMRIQPVTGAASALGLSGAGALIITYHPEDPVHTWALSANDIDLGIVGEWVDFAFTSDQQMVKIWDLLNPAGTVEALQIMGNQKAGAISFAGKDLSVDANDIFPQGWPPQALNFSSTWQEAKNKQSWAVNLTQFTMSNDHFTLNAQGNVKISANDPANPYLNLTANLEGKNLQDVRNYYIPKIGKGLPLWLEQGLVQLPVVNAQLTWRGKLHDMPYADKAHPGTFHLEVDTVDAAIQPWFNWPLISHLNAKLLFNNQRFTIDANEAKTRDVTLHKLHFDLKNMRPHLSTPTPIVITATANPSGTQALDYLANMPVVNPSVQNIIKTSFALSGPVPLTLNVQIPLHKANPTDPPVVVTGTATFKGNNVSRSYNNQMSVWFKSVTGVINFENQYLTSNNFSFIFKDLPCKVQIIKSPVNYLHLLIPQMQLYGQAYSAVNVFVQQAPADTKGEIKNPLLTFTLNDPNAVGTVILHPTGDVEANLDRWIIIPPAPNAPLPANTAAPPGSGSKTKIKTKTPPAVNTATSVPPDYLKHLGQVLSQVPPLQLNVKAFTYGTYNLGALMLQANPMNDGVAIQHLTLGDSDAELDIAGSIVTHNQQDEISVAGVVRGNNFGNALTQLGHGGVVDGGSGNIKFNFNWLGALMHPNWVTLQGDINFDVGSGKFLKVNTGLAQVFGLLSLNTVVSTFSLDFKGIFSGGLGFSRITGSYIIHNGIAHTDNLTLSGPTIDVRVKGDMDLVQQTINQTLMIKPQVGTSMALAAAFIGGPIVGAATFVANELLNNTVLKNTGFVYRITGPIATPKAEPVPVAEQNPQQQT
jgi:uncharacterized protein YhdP